MLRLTWVGAILLAYSVTNSLQNDFTSYRNLIKNEVLQNNGLNKYIQEQFRNFKPLNFYNRSNKERHDDKVANKEDNVEVTKQEGNNDASTELLRRRYEINMEPEAPKKIKFTFKRRYRVNKKEKPFESENITPNAANINESLTSKDANLIPALIKYLNDRKTANRITNENTTDDKVSTDANKNAGFNKHYVIIHRTAGKEENSAPSVKEDSELNKDRPGYDYTGLDVRNGKLENYSTENPSTIDTLESVTVKWNADLKSETEDSKTAKSIGLNSSPIDVFVKKLCLKSDINVVDFWKLAAEHFGLNDENLNDKQKYDLFSLILRNVKDAKKQEANEVAPDLNSIDVKWHERTDLEKEEQFDEVKLKNKKIFLTLPNDNSGRHRWKSNGLYPDIIESGDTKPENQPESVEPSVVLDSSTTTTSSTTESPIDYKIPVDSPKIVESSEIIFEPKNENITLNSIETERTTSIPTFDDEGNIDIIKINAQQKSKDPAEILLIRPKNLGIASDRRYINRNDLNDVIFEKNYNPDDNLYPVVRTENSSYEDFTKEPTWSKEDAEEDVHGSHDSIKSNISKELDNDRLQLLLRRLKGLPTDEVEYIVSYLKSKMNEPPKSLITVHRKFNSSRPLENPVVEVDEDYSEEPQLGKEKIEVISRLKEKVHPKVQPKYDLALRSKKPLDGNLSENESDRSINPKQDLINKALLEIIYKFREHGISDEALNNIVLYLKEATNEANSDCQSVKLNKVKKAFEDLLALEKNVQQSKM